MGVLFGGPTPEDGKSAYDLAVEFDGFIGTLQQYLDSLHGPQGIQGIPGPVPAVQWQGTKQRWQTPTGWGPLGPDLRGPAGPQGIPGAMPDISSLGGVQPYQYNGAGSANITSGGHANYSRVGNIITLNCGFYASSPFFTFLLPVNALSGFRYPIAFSPINLSTEGGVLSVQNGTNIATCILNGTPLPFQQREISLSFSYLGQ